MVNFHDFAAPATIASEGDAHKLLGAAGLDHAIFAHGIVVTVTAINLLWHYATYGYHTLLRALQHIHDSVHGLIAGDIVDVLVHDNLDYFHGELNAALGLMKATIDAGLATVPGLR